MKRREREKGDEGEDGEEERKKKKEKKAEQREIPTGNARSWITDQRQTVFSRSIPGLVS